MINYWFNSTELIEFLFVFFFEASLNLTYRTTFPIFVT